MAQTTNSPQAVIRNLEGKRYAAILDGDFDTFVTLCHAQLVYGHTGGNRDSLDTYLYKLRTGALEYHRINSAVDDIVIIGDTALVFGRMNAEITVNGINKTLDNSCLAVWSKDAGEWKFVAYQPTPRATQ